MHRIEFVEGYNLMRKIGADYFSSLFMAFVWCLRGDKIPD